MKAYRFVREIDDYVGKDSIYFPDLNILVSHYGVDNFDREDFDEALRREGIRKEDAVVEVDVHDVLARDFRDIKDRIDSLETDLEAKTVILHKKLGIGV